MEDETIILPDMESYAEFVNSFLFNNRDFLATLFSILSYQNPIDETIGKFYIEP